MPTIEMYRNNEFPEVHVLDQTLSTIARRCEEENALLEEVREKCEPLGLDGQVSLITNKKEEVEPDMREQSVLYPGNYYPTLSPQDEEVWSTWLPCVEDLKVYNERQLPPEILVELTLLYELKLFQWYEILTYSDEQTYECLLVGYFNHEDFLVARWGERLQSPKRVFSIIHRAMMLENLFCLESYEPPFFLCLVSSVLQSLPLYFGFVFFA